MASNDFKMCHLLLKKKAKLRELRHLIPLNGDIKQHGNPNHNGEKKNARVGLIEVVGWAGCANNGGQ